MTTSRRRDKIIGNQNLARKLMSHFTKYMKPSSTTLIGHRSNKEYQKNTEYTEILAFTAQCGDIRSHSKK
jgi:hypothetical protein